jgi:DNA-binding GntR family transcriptional regulator
MLSANEFCADAVKNLSTTLADRLVEMIETGVLRPGEHLVQIDLAEQFGVSRVSVRDALQQLLQKGLAVNVPRKGVIVRPVSAKTVRDLFDVRRLLESEATRNAAGHLSDLDYEQLDQIIGEQEELARNRDLAHFIEKDWEFHRTLYSRCDNEPLKEMIVQVWSRTRQARGIAQINPKWGEQWSESSTERHHRVLNALRHKDGDAAARFISDNIQVAAEELVIGISEIEQDGNGNAL